jgi:hypothetical protein
MTTPTEWKTEIARIVHWKQIAAQHDKRRALPWSLPKLGAKPEQILQAEATAGAPFSAEFKELLLLANGWKGFYILIDLFGTEDFITGRSEEVNQRPEIRDYVVRSGFVASHVVPIGASNAELDVFLMVSPTSTTDPGAVLWWANEEIDRFATFRDFFAAMVNYNAQVANNLAQRV